MFELFYLFKYIIDGEQSPMYESNSLFSEVIPIERGCRDIPLSSSSYCACAK